MTVKTLNDLDSRLMDLEEFLADEGYSKRTRIGYQLEAGRLRKAIAKRRQVLKRIEQGQRSFYGPEFDIALAEAEERVTAGGLKPHEQSLWAGVAFAIMQEAR